MDDYSYESYPEFGANITTAQDTSDTAIKSSLEEWIMDYGDSGFATIKPIPNFLWKPQLDITAHELALCIGIFISQNGTFVENLPYEARRHFERDD